MIFDAVVCLKEVDSETFFGIGTNNLFKHIFKSTRDFVWYYLEKYLILNTRAVSVMDCNNARFDGQICKQHVKSAFSPLSCFSLTALRKFKLLSCDDRHSDAMYG